jgi:hypothetical protein
MVIERIPMAVLFKTGAMGLPKSCRASWWTQVRRKAWKSPGPPSSSCLGGAEQQIPQGGPQIRFLKTLPGLVEGFVYEEIDGASVVTTAVWTDEEAP